MINQKSYYRPDIDGLRAIAVVAVIVNHFTNSILLSGYLGVDIFFVISGYVITSSIYNQKNKTFIKFLGDFYAKRIKRLIPALIFYVLLMSIIICLLRASVTGVLQNAMASLFGLSNIALCVCFKRLFFLFQM